MSCYAPPQSHSENACLGAASDADPFKVWPRLWQQPEPPEEPSRGLFKSQTYEVRLSFARFCREGVAPWRSNADVSQNTAGSFCGILFAAGNASAKTGSSSGGQRTNCPLYVGRSTRNA